MFSLFAFCLLIVISRSDLVSTPAAEWITYTNITMNPNVLTHYEISLFSNSTTSRIESGLCTTVERDEENKWVCQVVFYF